MTISLPPEMRREMNRAAKRGQVTPSEMVRAAIREKLWQEAVDESRRLLVPKARAQGIYTDEDVFARIS